MNGTITAARTAVIMVLALFVVACSSSHPRAASGFKAEYQAVERDYRTQFTALQSQARTVLGKDLDSQLTVFAKMTDTTANVVDRLRKLTPPDKVKTLYAQLVTTLSSQETSLRQVQTSAQNNDEAALNTALTGYASALQDGVSLLRQVDDALSSTSSSQ